MFPSHDRWGERVVKGGLVGDDYGHFYCTLEKARKSGPDVEGLVELLQHLGTRLKEEGLHQQGDVMHDAKAALTTLTQQRDQARAEALEEAAKVSSEIAQVHLAGERANSRYEVAELINNEILALIDQPPASDDGATPVNEALYEPGGRSPPPPAPAEDERDKLLRKGFLYGLEVAENTLDSGELYHRGKKHSSVSHSGYGLDPFYNAGAKDGRCWSQPYTLEEAALAIYKLRHDEKSIDAHLSKQEKEDG